MKATIYARSKTGEGNAISKQIETCKAYCEENGYSVAEDMIFSEVCTGTITTDHPELTQLRRAVQQGLIDVLVVASRDRFTREARSNALLIEQFKQMEIDVEIVNEQ